MKYLKKDLVEVIAKDTGFYKKDVEEVISDISCMANRYTSIDEIIDDYEKTYVK